MNSVRLTNNNYIAGYNFLLIKGKRNIYTSIILTSLHVSGIMKVVYPTIV